MLFRSLHYCYRLGYLPKYKKQNTARLHYLLKEDLLKLDKITAETRLLGRENISTDEQLFSYKESLKGQIKTLTDDRTHLRKIARTKMSDDELSKVKKQISTVSDKIRELNKEVRLCDDIAERSKVMEQNLETIRAEEEKQQRILVLVVKKTTSVESDGIFKHLAQKLNKKSLFLRLFLVRYA